MKAILYSLSFIILLSISLFSTSCDNDDDEKQIYRVSGRKFYSHDTLTSNARFNYTDEKIISIKYLVSSGYDSLKAELEYPDENTIIREYSFFHYWVWYPFMKDVFEYENDKMIRFTGYYLDGSYWTPYYREEYTYSGDLLSEEIWSDYQHSTWSPYGRITYGYSDHLPVRADYYAYQNDWILAARDEGFFSGDQIDYILSYDCTTGNCETVYKYEFSYIGNQPARIEEYFRFGSVWDTTGVFQFSYDPHGNLVMDSYTGETEVKKAVFEYEQGQGNYKDIVTPGGGLVPAGYYPAPVKSNPVILFKQNQRNYPYLSPGNHCRDKIQEKPRLPFCFLPVAI